MTLQRTLSGTCCKPVGFKNLNGKREKNGWRVLLSFLLSNELSWREEAGGRCPASESDQHNKRKRNGDDEASRKRGRFKCLLYSTGFKIEDCLLSWVVVVHEWQLADQNVSTFSSKVARVVRNQSNYFFSVRSRPPLIIFCTAVL